MAGDEKGSPETIENIWKSYLMAGRMPENVGEPWFASKYLRPIWRSLPDNPRCQLCYYPFRGIGGAVMKHLFGVEPSRLNPHLCNHCEMFAQKYKGGAEVELSILFADVRGSTQLAETMNPTEFSRLIHRFYQAATKVLYDSNAMVEKLIGDAVTGFFTPGYAGQQHARVAVQAAQRILKATGHGQPGGPWIPVGVGVHTGLAYVGTIESEPGLTDVAVLGDTANVGARLAAQAAAGEVHVSQATAQAAGLDPAEAKIRRQAVKGRSELLEVWVI